MLAIPRFSFGLSGYSSRALEAGSKPSLHFYTLARERGTRQNVGDGYPTPCTGDGFSPILGQAAASSEPGEGALDRPPTGQDLEPIGGV